jgi:N-acetylmuramoyl-L-alanine amidase
MTDQEFLTAIGFSETKDLGDFINVGNVVKNRAMNPQRYGEGIEGVITKPHQFSGYNSPEFKKALNKKFTPEEQRIYEKFYHAAGAILSGMLTDTTDGATHYFNPKLVKPKWSEKMEKKTSTDYHDYYKE